MFGNNLILSQFQCDEERFLLSLRAIFSKRIATNFERQIVAMNTTTRILIDQILLSMRTQQLLEGLVVQFRAVTDLDLLAVARQTSVVIGHDRANALDEFGTLCVNRISIRN